MLFMLPGVQCVPLFLTRMRGCFLGRNRWVALRFALIMGSLQLASLGFDILDPFPAVV